jgi:lysozyme|tara:strand:+ start:28 stop:471 length:444 start_codon:yes stop_codon:yes gene_type:complete
MDLDKLKEEIKTDEGVIYEVYLDHLGYKTCGVGHLCRATDPENKLEVGDPVSVERVDILFAEDLETTIDECKLLYNNFDDLPEEVQRIIANMMFNMGRPRLSRFHKMKKAVDNGDWTEASVQMKDSLWARQVPNRADRLVKRMEAVT